MSRLVAEQLQNVRFIGGGTGSGKSTLARRLAAKYDFAVYHTDPLSRYADRLSVDHAPLLHSFLAMDMDERWLNRPPDVMRDTFHGFCGEGFHLVVDDLLALPTSRFVLAEGFMLLPRLVAPLLSHSRQAVWLIATPEFRRMAFDSRGSTYSIAGKTSDPEGALANLLARDQIFTEDIATEATALDLPLVEVDIGTSVDDLEGQVAEALDLAQA